MNYELIRQLITCVETFEQQVPTQEQQTLPNFTGWLTQQGALNQAGQPTQVDETLFEDESPDTLIGIMVSFVFRYARLYSKKALGTSNLTTLDEFSYLVMLLEGPAPTKSELIERNIHEKTTGIEILKRLLAMGLIEQVDDVVDRRSKRLKLTEQGQAELFRIMPFMQQVATLIGGNLTLNEKKQLVYLLNKLHLFHNPIFLEERGQPIDELLKKLS